MSGRREVSSAGGGGGASLTLSQYLFLKWSLPILKPGVHRSPPVRSAPQHGPESGSEGSSGSRGGGWALCWKLEASRSFMSKKSADAAPVGSCPPRGKDAAIPFVRSSDLWRPEKAEGIQPEGRKNDSPMAGMEEVEGKWSNLMLSMNLHTFCPLEVPPPDGDADVESEQPIAVLNASKLRGR